MEFEPLYLVNKNGKTQIWKLAVQQRESHAVIMTEFGQVDGKMQTSEVIVDKGKNIGKKNATTPLSQAISEAKSKYTKQLAKGYAIKTTDNLGTKVSPILPMLAENYSKRAHNIKWPAYVQPKLDGVRCVAMLHHDKVILWSRTGKQMEFLDHIREGIKDLWKVLPHDTYLDGELYSDEIPFEKVTGLCRQKKPSSEQLEEMKYIKYHVYDLIMPGTFKARHMLLEMLPEYVGVWKKVLTEMVDHHDEMITKHQIYVDQGYEGIMIRNEDGEYLIKNRSAHLQKFKMMQDAEFKIIDYTQGKGRDAGTVIWKCTSDAGDFMVRPKGTVAERQNWFENGDKYIGKLLTVTFQEMTKDGIPRFPVGKVIRDYE